jgi:hypothetical protein
LTAGGHDGPIVSLSVTITQLNPWQSIFGLLVVTLAAAAQNPPPAQPPVKVNVVNVCAPSPEEQKDIAAVLGRLPMQPRFAIDFAVTRGRTTAPDAPISNWVRLRREFAADAPFTAAQYSFSVDEKGMIEALMFRAREGSDLVQVVLEDKVTSGTPAALLSADTPATRIRVERLGKPNRGLARCPDSDQSTYQPLFDRASQVLRGYRKLLNVRSTVGAELAKLGVADAVAPKPQPTRKPASR